MHYINIYIFFVIKYHTSKFTLRNRTASTRDKFLKVDVFVEMGRKNWRWCNALPLPRAKNLCSEKIERLSVLPLNTPKKYFFENNNSPLRRTRLKIQDTLDISKDNIIELSEKSFATRSITSGNLVAYAPCKTYLHMIYQNLTNLIYWMELKTFN